MATMSRFAFLPLLLLSVADPSITTAGASSTTTSSNKVVDCSGLRDNPIQIPKTNLVLNAILNPVDNTMTAELVYLGQAWLSIGWAPGKSVMIGSQAVIGWPDKEPSLTNPGKYDMNTLTSEGVVLMKNSRQTLTNATIVQNSTHTVLKFTKILEESNENSISSTAKTWLVWAVGFDNSAQFHIKAGGFAIKLNQCAVSEGGVIVNQGDQNSQGAVEIEAEDNNRDLWIAHGMTAAVAWAILVPLAVGAAIIRKLFEAAGLSKGLWFQLHRGLNSLAALLTIVSFSIAVYIFNKEPNPVHFSEDPHHTVGLLIFIITLLQALNGIFRPSLPHHTDEPVIKHDDDDEEEDKTEEPKAHSESGKSTTRIIWEIGHRILGVGLLAMSWWQIQDGIGLFLERFPLDNDLTPAFWGVAIGITAAIVILFIIQTFVVRSPKK